MVEVDKMRLKKGEKVKEKALIRMSSKKYEKE